MGVPKSFGSQKLASKLSYLSLVSHLAAMWRGASVASNITNITDVSVSCMIQAKVASRLGFVKIGRFG